MAKDLSINEKCEEFAENTSLHGLKNVAGSAIKLFRRAIWLLLMLLMLGFLLYYFITGLTRYLDYPTTTKMNLFENGSLMFPAVTICNNDLIRKEYMDQHPLESNVTASYVPTFRVAPTVNLSDPLIIEQMQNSTYIDMFTEGAHRMEDMFEMCTWKSLSINCLEYFVPMLTDIYGQCYTFNANGSATIDSAGIYNGLDVVIDVEQDQYSQYGASAGAGVKVLTHEPNAFPILQTKALSIPPGVVSEFMIYRKENIFLPSPYEGPGCHEPNNYDSLADCKLKCNVNYLVTKCGCQSMPYLQLLSAYPNCSLYEFTQCIVPAAAEYWSNKSIEASCGCLHNCSEVNYDVKHSQMLFPSTYASSFYNENYGLTLSAEQYRESVVYLRIYFDTLLTTITEQVPAYTFANFSAEIGGYMGLFLGASLLTLTELLEFTVVLLTSFCKKNNTVKEKKMVYDD